MMMIEIFLPRPDKPVRRLQDYGPMCRILDGAREEICREKVYVHSIQSRRDTLQSQKRAKPPNTFEAKSKANKFITTKEVTLVTKYSSFRCISNTGSALFQPQHFHLLHICHWFWLSFDSSLFPPPLLHTEFWFCLYLYVSLPTRYLNINFVLVPILNNSPFYYTGSITSLKLIPPTFSLTQPD